MKYSVTLEFESLQELQGWAGQNNGSPALLPNGAEDLDEWNIRFCAALDMVALTTRTRNSISRAANIRKGRVIRDPTGTWPEVPVTPYVENRSAFIDGANGGLLEFLDWTRLVKTNPAFRNKLKVIRNLGKKGILELREKLP